MKKLTGIVGITLVSTLLIVPVAVWAFGWGRGTNHMSGYWGAGPSQYGQYNNNYTTLNSKQQEQLAALNQKFFNETKSLRDRLWSESNELNTLLSETNPDTANVARLQKNISDLRAKLDEKVINHETEARKIVPNNRYGYGPMIGGYGMSYGMGYGMGGNGTGYGSGTCWN